MIAVLYQDFRQGEGETVYAIDVTLNEEYSTGLVRDREAIRQLRRSTESIEDRLFMVRPSDARTFVETSLPFVSTLVVDPIENFVKDRLYDGPKVR